MSSSIEIIENQSGQFIYINNESCEARISLFGGQVIHWQPHNQPPVLWLSETSDDTGATAIRGGIPICWPWFGPAQHGRHGLARTANWTLIETKEESDVTVVKIACDIGEDTAFGLNYPQHIEQTLLLGKTLHQTCTVKNSRGSPAQFAYALHNYFNIGHINEIVIDGLTNKPYSDKITNEYNELGDKQAPEYKGPIDRIYTSEDDTIITDALLGRRIHLTKRHANEWVLWNPGSGAKKMKDIHEGGQKNFVCIEAAHTQNVIIEGNSHLSFGQTISVSSL